MGESAKPVPKWRACPACGGSLSRWTDDQRRTRCPSCGTALYQTTGDWRHTGLVGLAVFTPSLLLYRLGTTLSASLLVIGGPPVLAMWLWTLFHRRWAVDTKANRDWCTRCGYDLRSTLTAGGTACPECGLPIEGTKPPSS